MAPESETRTDAETRSETDETPCVNARCVSEDRTVFTEEGNPDGWISTDLTVSSPE